MNIQKWLGGLLLFLAMFVVVQTAIINRSVENNSEAQLALVKSAQDCNIEFQRVLKERAEASEIDTKLRYERIEALDVAVQAIIDNLEGNYTLDGTALALRDYLVVSGKTQVAARDAQKVRDANPYPDPRCSLDDNPND